DCGSLFHDKYTPAKSGQCDRGCGARRASTDDDNIPSRGIGVVLAGRRHSSAVVIRRLIERRDTLFFEEAILAIVVQELAVVILGWKYHAQFGPRIDHLVVPIIRRQWFALGIISAEPFTVGSRLVLRIILENNIWSLGWPPSRIARPEIAVPRT